jgi:retron-type reverse transcriptase
VNGPGPKEEVSRAGAPHSNARDRACPPGRVFFQLFQVMETALTILAKGDDLESMIVAAGIAVFVILIFVFMNAAKNQSRKRSAPPRRIIPPPAAPPPPQDVWPPPAASTRNMSPRSMQPPPAPPGTMRFPTGPASVTSGRPSAPATPFRPAPATPAAAAASVPQTQKLNLDAGAFTPISDKEATTEARGIGNLWGNPWFGRRDLIPPAEDPRTNLIDRAMVGHGLITPEELVRIHELGRTMDEIRPDLASAQAAGLRAVAEDRAERAKLKEQKKKEAEERKRRHAEAVKQRKATDIIFLGRGVSKGLADRRSHVEKLQAAGLPVLSTAADVATALKLTIPRLRFLAFHADATPVSHYVRFAVPKRSGGERWLAAPMPQLAATQEWILINILEKLPVHAAAHGFVAGRSTVSNAQPHVKKTIVVNTDLKDFFPTVTFRRVAGLFREIGYSPAVSTILALLCTDAPRRKVVYADKTFYVAAGARALPQGACTSPAISNLVAKRLDSRLSGITGKLGWTYTRYADDLSFSASGEEAKEKIGYVLARVRHIAQDEGFAVNETKTRVLRQNNLQLVTGVVVNDRAGIDRPTVRRLRAILHRAKFEGLRAQNREKIPHFEAWVSGMIAYVHMVNPRQAAPLREAFDKLTST